VITKDPKNPLIGSTISSWPTTTPVVFITTDNTITPLTTKYIVVSSSISSSVSDTQITSKAPSSLVPQPTTTAVFQTITTTPFETTITGTGTDLPFVPFEYYNYEDEQFPEVYRPDINKTTPPPSAEVSGISGEVEESGIDEIDEYYDSFEIVAKLGD
jgi:hypothetical protein